MTALERRDPEEGRNRSPQEVERQANANADAHFSWLHRIAQPRHDQAIPYTLCPLCQSKGWR